jgi:hypothetical protein
MGELYVSLPQKTKPKNPTHNSILGYGQKKPAVSLRM